VLVIPPLLSALSFSGREIWQLNAYVNLGGRLIVAGGSGGHELELLNTVFGFKLSKHVQTLRSQKQAATCDVLCTGPSSLKFRKAVRTSSLPKGARIEYAAGTKYTQAFSFHVGRGIIVYLSQFPRFWTPIPEVIKAYQMAFTQNSEVSNIPVRLTARRWLTPPAASRYVPGTPGGSWTLDEVLIVKSKLWRLFSKIQSEAAFDELFPKGHPYSKFFDTYRPAGKMVRLGFHDCLLYSDLSGGCDGCLHWDGMGARFKSFHLKILTGDGVTHNNGLAPVAELLEWIYTDPTFPERTPSLPQSLFDSGKSRADLWALAAIVGVEYTIMINNNVCKDKNFENPFSGKEGPFYPDLPNGGIHCNSMQGKTGCKVKLARRIQFKYGRKDCAPTPRLDKAYATMKKESHPDPEANGLTTLKWFQKNFKFTYRETAAIMGAHTLGRMHKSHSLFHYTWVFRGGMQFNNQYYRNLVRSPDNMWDFNHHSSCIQQNAGSSRSRSRRSSRRRRRSSRSRSRKGKAAQVSPPVRILAKAQSDTKVGGPIHWVIQRQVRGTWTFYPHELEEMMLSSDMGLYWRFNVDDKKFPKDCEGLTGFKHYKTQVGQPLFSDGQPQCNLQTEKQSNDKPLHKIIEDYARDQAIWIRDFIPAFEKMLSNGYAPNELTDGPDQFSNVICSDREDITNVHRYWLCFNANLMGKKRLTITSLQDRKTLLWNAELNVPQVGTSSQIWSWNSGTRQLVNDKNHVLAVEGCATWVLEGQKIKCIEVTKKIDPLEGKYLTRGGSTSVLLSPDIRDASEQRWSIA